MLENIYGTNTSKVKLIVIGLMAICFGIILTKMIIPELINGYLWLGAIIFTFMYYIFGVVYLIKNRSKTVKKQ